MSDLNQAGDIVGARLTQRPLGGGYVQEPFLWRKNQYIKVNDLLGLSPAWVIEGVIALNDRGQMLCVGVPFDPARRITQTHDGWANTCQHALVVTPVLAPVLSQRPR